MTLYTRRQLLVLLILLAAGGSGLAVGHWRRAHPDVVERVELLDRAPAPVDSVAVPPHESRPRAARPTPEAEPRRARRGRPPHGTPSIATADSAPAPENSDVDRTSDVSTPCP